MKTIYQPDAKRILDRIGDKLNLLNVLLLQQKTYERAIEEDEENKYTFIDFDKVEIENELYSLQNYVKSLMEIETFYTIREL